MFLVFSVAPLPPLPSKTLIPKSTCKSPISRRISLLSSLSLLSSSSSAAAAAAFSALPNSGGLQFLDLRLGSGPSPLAGDQIAIHYYGRLAAKQGWRFDSTYDHKDEMGNPIPFVFVLGSGKVISGIEAAVKSMKVGGIRRVVIPPSQGYQNTSQEPIPPNVDNGAQGSAKDLTCIKVSHACNLQHNKRVKFSKKISVILINKL